MLKRIATPKIIFDDDVYIYLFYLEKNGYDEHIIKNIKNKDIAKAIDFLCVFLQNTPFDINNIESIKNTKNTIDFFFQILENPDNYVSFLALKKKAIIDTLCKIYEKIINNVLINICVNFETFNVLEKEGLINQVDKYINRIYNISAEGNKFYHLLAILLKYYYNKNWLKYFDNVIKSNETHNTEKKFLIENLLCYLDPNNQNSFFAFQFESNTEKKQILDEVLEIIYFVLEKDEHIRLSLEAKFNSILENYSDICSIQKFLDYYFITKNYSLILKLLEKNIANNEILLNKCFNQNQSSFYFEEEYEEKLEFSITNLSNIINFIRNNISILILEPANKQSIKKQIEKFFRLLKIIETKNNLNWGYREMSNKTGVNELVNEDFRRSHIFTRLDSLKDLFLEIEKQI